MYCPNCGTQNNDGAGFCANCGASLTPNVNAAPMPAAVPVAALPEQKTNGLCIAGLIVSLVSIILAGTTAIIGLILSIIGLISAGKKNEKGKGAAIAGIIISSILAVLFVFILISGVGQYYKKVEEAREGYSRYTTEYEETTRRTTRETTEETTRESSRETNEETSESRSGVYLTSVGNAKTGTVSLTSGKWITFRETGGFSSEVIEHEQAKDMSTGSIIGLFVLNVDYSAEDLAKSQMYSMEQAGAQNVTGARVKLGGYDAVQCYGSYSDGMILVCWFFKGDDGQMRKITVEFPTGKSSAFHLVEDGYKLDR